MPVRGLPLDSLLYQGSQSVVARLETAFLQHTAIEDPWIIQFSTRAGAESWVNRYNEEFAAAQVRGNSMAARQIVDDVKQRLIDAFGPTISCRLRFKVYIKGGSADPIISTDLTVTPDYSDFEGEGGAWDMSMLLAQNAQLHASVIHMAGHLTTAFVGAQHTISTQEAVIANLGATRSVASAAADAGSSWTSLLMGVGIVMFMPEIKKALGLKEDGALTPMIGRLFAQRLKASMHATEAEAAADEWMNGVPQLEEGEEPAGLIEDQGLEDAPVFDAEYGESIPDDFDAAREAELVYAKAKQHPELTEELIERVMADEEMSAALMSKFNPFK